MKVAITSTGPTLDVAMDPRFGRCAWFMLVETDDMTFEAGNCGPNAHQTLSAAGIDVFVDCSGTVGEAVERFKSGQLHAVSAPNVASHAGMGGDRR